MARDQSSKVRGRQILLMGTAHPQQKWSLRLTLGCSEPLLIQGEPCPQRKAGFTAARTILRGQGLRGLPYLEWNPHNHLIAVFQVENVLLESQSVIWNSITLRFLDKNKILKHFLTCGGKRRGWKLSTIGVTGENLCLPILGTCEFPQSLASIQAVSMICSQQNSKNSQIISRVCLCVCNIHTKLF